jgi:N-acetylglutamate synthase
MPDSVALLEEVAFRMWPAAEVSELAGWRLRFSRGVTRRANSVWPNAADDEMGVDRRLDAVEAWYAARGVPARYQITEACQPPDLDRRLEGRGYTVEAPVSVQTAELNQFRMAGQPPQILTSVLPKPTDEWVRLSVDHGRFAETKTSYLEILDRIGLRGGYAVARWKGKPVATGIGVVDGDWLGVFAMATVPEARRRRAATAVLGALVAWAATRRATRAFLQVEKDNDAALALYKACGFSERYPYHYRTRPSEPHGAAKEISSVSASEG